MSPTAAGLLGQTLRAVSHRLTLGRAQHFGGRRPDSETLILFFNTMWDQALETEGVPLPDRCHVTTDRNRFGQAAAVVFHIPSLGALPTRKPPGQLWVAWLLECAANCPRLCNSAYMRGFDLTMTYRLDSDVPTAYTCYYSDVDNLARALRTAPKPKPPTNLATLFISSGINSSGRIEYATELMRYLDLHAYGKIPRNRHIPDDQWRPSKLGVIADYQFDLAFENAIADDYVSEKFFDPLVAGTVPVYLGAPNVERFAPGDHCFINTADFSGPKELADYLRYLQIHPAEYGVYLAWKDRPFRSAFLSLLEGQREPFLVRLCRAILERRKAHDSSTATIGPSPADAGRC
jgi:hypothetical protein